MKEAPCTKCVGLLFYILAKFGYRSTIEPDKRPPQPKGIMFKLPYSVHRRWFLLTQPFRRTYTATVCGHKTKLRREFVFQKEMDLITLGLDKNTGQPKYCLECFDKMSIRCAWCGKSIRVNDPITLNLIPQSFVIPEYAVRHEESLVGCLRWECCDTSLARAGFWQAPGEVRQFGSLAAKVMGSGLPGVVGDLSDPTDQGTLVKIDIQT